MKGEKGGLGFLVNRKGLLLSDTESSTYPETFIYTMFQHLSIAPGYK